MPKFKNISPLGALDVPILGRIVDAEEVFDATDEQAAYLEGQDANFEPAEDATPTGTKPESHDPQPNADDETEGDR